MIFGQIITLMLDDCHDCRDDQENGTERVLMVESNTI